MGKNLPAKAGDTVDEGLIPGSGRCACINMATHSSILAWEIPWTEELGGLQSMGSQESDTTVWQTLDIAFRDSTAGQIVLMPEEGSLWEQALAWWGVLPLFLQGILLYWQQFSTLFCLEAPDIPEQEAPAVLRQSWYTGVWIHRMIEPLFKVLAQFCTL